MASEQSFGELRPRITIQEDTRACLSTCLLSQVESSSGVSEEIINQVLAGDGLYEPGIGANLVPAKELDVSLFKLGLHASPVYDARTLSNDEEPKVLERLQQIDIALRSGKKALLAFPKRREGQAPFLHYCIVSGFTDTDDGSGVVIMDPSDIDGGIKYPTLDELKNYVTPTAEIPVMAWGISKAWEIQLDRDRENENETETSILPGWDLLRNPLSDENDTGKSIPTGTRHPTSVAMPTTAITRDFTNFGPVVLSRNGNCPVGYPRFVIPPQVKEVSIKVMGNMNFLPFPSEQSANAAHYLEETYGHATLKPIEKEGVYWLPGSRENTEAWQHTGLGISSRQAEAIAEGRPHNNIERRDTAENKIKKTIEFHTNARPEDIYLFPTGMAAIYWLNQAMIRMSDDAPAAQFGFPYADTYEQRKYGPKLEVRRNMLDFRGGDYARLAGYLAAEGSLRGVITEIPTNPLLWTPDISRLDECIDGRAPIVIDDTVSTVYNLDDTKLPDSIAARVTSLTKFFSSVGDVMGGSITLRPESPHYEKLKTALDELYEDTLWYEDAEVLAQNSRLFPEVMPVINHNGEELARRLGQQYTGPDKPLKAVYHPSRTNTTSYDMVRKETGGYGGLMSLRFNDPQRAYRFYDALRITKGPSLGTFYTLGCLYTLLAHPNVEAVMKFDVVPDLVRISAGIEDTDDLHERFDEALRLSAR